MAHPPDPDPAGPPEPKDDALSASVRRQSARRLNWLRHGEPSMVRYVGQIGVLGWIIVAPTLVGLFLGRWLDRKFGTGIFWSAPLLMLGVVAGCWSAWRWMHKQ
jgi:ATP synthase protein I